MATRRKQRVILMGDFVLQGTDTAICQRGLSSREAYHLPVAHVRDDVQGLPKLTWLSDYYPLLLFLVGM